MSFEQVSTNSTGAVSRNGKRLPLPAPRVKSERSANRAASVGTRPNPHGVLSHGTGAHGGRAGFVERFTTRRLRKGRTSPITAPRACSGRPKAGDRPQRLCAHPTALR